MTPSADDLRLLLWVIGGCFALVTGGGGLLLAWIRLRRDDAAARAKISADSEAAQAKRLTDVVTLAIAPLRVELEQSQREHRSRLDNIANEWTLRFSHVVSTTDHGELKSRVAHLESSKSDLYGEVQRVDNAVRDLQSKIDRLRTACKIHHSGSHADQESEFPR